MEAENGMLRVSELTGALLDYWVARAEGKCPYLFNFYCFLTPPHNNSGTAYAPSTDWAQGGPIIERERIRIMPTIPSGATWYSGISTGSTMADVHSYRAQSDTPLVAAMRAFVTSKFGDEVSAQT